MRAPMRRADFHFDLPDELIARHPASERSASRLLHLDGRTGAIVDRQFRDLPRLLSAGDLLVFNDTRVVPARLFGHKRDSGGKVEVMLERLLGGRLALVQLRASKPVRPGAVIEVAGDCLLTVEDRAEEFWRVAFDLEAHEVFERYGEMPLPPYVKRAAEPADRERYQTVYAREPGAVAAPTAGLHFDAGVLDACRAAGVQFARVTLHVGAGTFQPVRVDDLAEHRMHAEIFEVPQATVEAIAATRERRGRVVAVGTTAVRALESAAEAGEVRATTGETRLFITPGRTFRVVDRLITNFHLPESTLLMLVSAFATREHVLSAYAHAIEHAYRFFSYGDAMLVEPAPAALAPRSGGA
ncbi:MAG TPA: tRNA preQ1(34) S-adenosylmethionine ribosyltransferase-isomerase QueA [Steroidobacteraceae bacterium]|nr:tRNA preQ1(34) S-adenosylmethionine ribosyltransferase-isomerase QueA [Steroidobacteraceae bacterium]